MALVYCYLAVRLLYNKLKQKMKTEGKFKGIVKSKNNKILIAVEPNGIKERVTGLIQLIDPYKK